LSNAEFIVEANVTEGITGLMMTDSDEIRFYDSPAQIEFVSSLPNNYKPGLKYTALVSRFLMKLIYSLSTRLKLPHVWAGPKSGPGFPTSYVVVFFYLDFSEFS
jgi:hypothetical protein